MVKRVRVQAVEITTGTRVRLTFTNGGQREMDLAPYLRGPIFEAYRTQPSEFGQLKVDPELGTIVWPNGADIDPDVLYEGLTPAWQEAEAPASS